MYLTSVCINTLRFTYSNPLYPTTPFLMSSVKEHIDNAQSDAASVCSDDVPNDNVRLHLKTNSLRNNVISCDSLGLHYQVSTDTSGFRAHRMIYISKWIPSTDKQIPLAEWKRYVPNYSFINNN